MFLYVEGEDQVEGYFLNVLLHLFLFHLFHSYLLSYMLGTVEYRNGHDSAFDFKESLEHCVHN